MSFADNTVKITIFKNLPPSQQKRIISKIIKMITNKKTKFSFISLSPYILAGINIRKSTWAEIACAAPEKNLCDKKVILFSWPSRPNMVILHGIKNYKFNRIIFERLPREVELLLACINWPTFDYYRKFLGISNEHSKDTR